ncbi:hypothetical protein [Acidithiobacillus ferriphilus]|uniref:hypothetical protein n=1 Tax=Acidithiobacillus ferriphilus TaxID=1689834 RepID=UPI001D015E96|nr:hypothetical protein [Acidithiobacillus ferriphilus]
MVSRSTAWPARPTASAPAPTQMLGVPPLLWLYIVLNGVGAGPRTALLFVGIIGYLGDVLGGGAFFGVGGEHGQPLKDPLAVVIGRRRRVWRNSRRIANISAEAA